MPKAFSPGATLSRKKPRPSRCLWREEALMLHLIQEAINPPLGLARCIANWPQISFDLREPCRKRVSQLTSLRQIGTLLS